MSKLEEKLAKSLTAETTELIPFLPYLLQDLWDMGSSPRDMEALIGKHVPAPEKAKVLDLACGKGAVGIHLAKTFGCTVKGVDLLPEFIEEARKRAVEHGVEALCSFRVEDANQAVEKERNYDIVILGAAGDVLGSPKETVEKLKPAVKPSGHILIDDAYVPEGSPMDYPTRADWLEVFREVGVRLVDELAFDGAALTALNETQQACIRTRARELQVLHPEKTALFEGYVQSQEAECEELEGEMTALTWLLQKSE
ncbi:class I SAM-dependent methyltransferase [Anaerotalea alkaliphila]|uniref:Class I SAM-dependent methyltransferase n=1 Tax=Anaerotalea alkaliphila TaxID=2662126 RepID=A0A7X5HXR0_9FIRM|nr:class I SAM-dependent methyltransferase [Anaerotalea alkaliphila]NDL68558.1 class I SAM-dependent methyltransferase [Anaerotalea alkaliphila]